MGDSGSLMLGLFNAILVLKFISVAETGAVPFQVESVVPVGISILMIPLLDTLRVFSIRIFHGRSPFSPDRNHIHHLLLDKGLSHKHVTLCCLLLNIFFISLAYFGRMMGPTVLLCTLALVAFAFLGVLIYYKKPFIRSTTFVLSATKGNGASTTTKVVSLSSDSATASVAE
jgi:UDP-N-acetylmuramyl pentapeptide phosphotransferase/UDP-N-acetylglucosamine-1-phosphate transferase